ncbi:MAG: ATP-binding protein [Desulfobacterales bacterium]
MSAGISIILVGILLSLFLVTSGRIAERTKKHEILDKVRTGVSELDILTYDYLLNREERMEHQWHSKYNSLAEILDEAAKEELTSIRTDYASISDLFTKITERNQKTQKLIQEGTSQEKIDSAIALEERLVVHLLITSHSIFTAASILAEGAQAEVMAIQRLSTILIISLMIILFIIVTTSTLIITRSISKPMDELIKGVEIIGKGDLEHKVEVQTKDELGQLATAFNHMTENLYQDITERRKAELALKERMKELRTLYNITEISGRTGITLEEIYRESIEQIPLAWQYPEITGGCITIDGEAFKTKNFKKTKWMQKEDIQVSGKIVGTIEVCYLQEKSDDDEGPFLKEERKLIKNISKQMGEHITRFQAESRQRQYKHIVSSSTDMMALLDTQFYYLSANEAYMKAFKLTSEKLIGRTVIEVFGDKFFKNTIKPNADRCMNGYIVNHQGWIDFPAFKKKRYMDIFYYPYYSKDNKIVGFVVNGRNITERMRAEEKLQKYQLHLEKLVEERTKELAETNIDLAAANKELEAFSYSVSHDLRAPLRAIDGFTRILIEDYASKLDKEGKRIGSTIHDNAKKMGRLIDDLLAFSRLGRASMTPTKIDMENMVNAMYHEATSAEERKRIKFSIVDLPAIEGDTNLMRQVWMNLISNAVKYSSKCKQSVISVTSKDEKKKVTYCIKDNGVGFDMKYVDKLYGVFERLHSEKDFKGTGIGLSLVKRIIKRHGGEVWAEGKVDKGASFYFSLPNKRNLKK